jgi:hypothetical protein
MDFPGPRDLCEKKVLLISILIVAIILYLFTQTAVESQGESESPDAFPDDEFPNVEIIEGTNRTDMPPGFKIQGPDDTSPEQPDPL